MFIVDAHLDLAYNALGYDRNPQHPLAHIRATETPNRDRGQATVSFEAMQKGGVGLCFGTLFVFPAGRRNPSFDNRVIYRTAQEAHKQAMDQLDYYHRLSDGDSRILLAGDVAALDAVIASHQTEAVENRQNPLIGIVPLMEGADPIRQPEEVEYWHERGLRAIGLAWDDTRYADGDWNARRGLTDDGRLLLEIMAEYNFILDLTHMSDKSIHEAIDRYEGPIIASHSNCRVLVPHQRLLTDAQIRLIGERGGVIGTVLFNKFLRRQHAMGDPKQRVTLDYVVAHIDHVCQVLGSADHVGIGSDLDGGFGREDIPAEMDSIADLPLIAGKLRECGYAEADIVNIMGGNWINMLRRVFD
ncbi:MAG: peptidase M19 [Chloroflexi bacterium]|nr:peptidase M19 [Chloroflexota bacterium]